MTVIMRRFLADFDELRNSRASQAFDKVMNVQRPIPTRANGSMSYVASWTELSPTQAGLAAALRRAFEMPADEGARKFDELLSQLN
jgi:hypothetical protein